MREISQQGRAQPEWRSYHIFHSVSGDPVLRGLVLPAVRELWSSQRFLRFFFIRFGEGGLHVRLRFLCRVEDRQEIAATLATRAAEFFGHAHSDDSAGRVIAAPFEPETERYGGTELLGHSMDFFCLSSVHALQHVERHQEKPRLLALALRTLVRQALGFVSDANELARLMAYAVNGEWKRRTPLEERADREFEERREDYLRLLAEEIEGSFQSGARLTDTLLAEGALLLSQLTRGADSPVRWRIQSSQLHMTWNRMGIQNLEEIYLGRILWRAARHALDVRDDLRSTLAAALARRQIQSKGGFETLIGESLAQLAKPFPRKLSERRRIG